MKLKIDLSKEYGLVLEGGGAKGAYQIGAWKALREAGVKIKGIAGVSVGALNGALICMDDLDGALELWENIRYSHVMNVNDNLMDGVMSRKLKEFNFSQIVKDGVKIISDGGFDAGPLKQLIDGKISEEKIRNSDIDLYIVTYSVSDRELLEVNVKDIPDGLIGDMLLASAYYLAFKHDKLHGKKYLDGGGWNNVPLDALIEQGYQDIIVLRIYGYGLKRRVDIPAGTNIINIAPRRKLGRTLEFNQKRSRRNLQWGYYDAMKVLYGLQGRRYYLDMPEEEGYYFRKLTKKMECFIQSGEYQVSYRNMLEERLPAIAVRLNLKPEWTYKDLYLGLLEWAAVKLKINRFQIFTEEEFLRKLREVLAVEKQTPDWQDEDLELLDKFLNIC